MVNSDYKKRYKYYCHGHPKIIYDNNKCLQGCKETESLTYCEWEYKMVQPLWNMAVSYKTKTCCLPYNQEIHSQVISQRNENMFTEKPVHECA